MKRGKDAGDFHEVFKTRERFCVADVLEYDNYTLISALFWRLYDVR